MCCLYKPLWLGSKWSQAISVVFSTWWKGQVDLWSAGSVIFGRFSLLFCLCKSSNQERQTIKCSSRQTKILILVVKASTVDSKWLPWCVDVTDKNTHPVPRQLFVRPKQGAVSQRYFSLDLEQVLPLASVHVCEQPGLSVLHRLCTLSTNFFHCSATSRNRLLSNSYPQDITFMEVFTTILLII